MIIRVLHRVLEELIISRARSASSTEANWLSKDGPREDDQLLAVTCLVMLVCDRVGRFIVEGSLLNW